MQPAPPLQPTLGRTCRALANRTRLRLFASLAQQPGQTVDALAQGVGIPPAVTSQYLRRLEARGLLTAERVGRRVKYRPSEAPNSSNMSGLAAALVRSFRGGANPVESLFKLATAFTHPRRTELFGLVSRQPHTAVELRAVTKMSSWGLARHLRKLESRGFIAREGQRYGAVKPPSEVRRELARLAVR